MSKVLTILLAGGKGTRLDPLTRDRAKPAVPFGGMYRVVDFALSNCINSAQLNILVLTQYKSLSLERHIGQGWARFFHPEFHQRLTIAPAQQRVGDDWYQGTADAVFQNIYSVVGSGAEYLLVLAGDHVYKMDYRRILEFHQDHHGVATVATLRVPVAEAAGQFGVVQVDAASRVVGFQEKPECPASIPGDSGYCLASMGIYVFNSRFLIDELRTDSQAPVPGRDFGHHTLPMMIGRGDVYAFAFSGAGTSATAYWRDVGTLDSYYRASMDLLTDVHGLDLYDRAWPIYSFQPSFPPPLVAVVPEPPASIDGGPGRNIFANGTMADGWLRGSVVGFDCRIEPGAIVEDSILFDSVVIGRGAQVHRAILDKRVRIGPGARIGLDQAKDLERGLVVSAQGITCVPKGAVVDAC